MRAQLARGVVRSTTKVTQAQAAPENAGAICVRTVRKRSVLFGLGVLLFLSAALLPSASAQISPGPLSRPHQSLNGSTNCASCHKFGGQAALKCLDCHTEIATRLSARKGLHATYNIPAGSSQECARCHSEHNGEDFPLIKWDIKTFNHKDAGYLLEGKHAGLTCNKCHNSSRISPQERTSIKIKDLNRTYLGLSTACVACHEDQHKGRLGPTCQTCHNFEDWKAISVGQGPGQFDHSKTRYPLTGLHAQVQCAKCHTNGADGKPRYVGIPFNQCSDCHKDPHHGSFPAGLPVVPQHERLEKNLTAGSQRALRPLEDQVSARRQARQRGVRAVPCQRRLQEAAGVPKVHGLPQARSA